MDALIGTTPVPEPVSLSLPVEGMSCASCVGRVEHVLKALPGAGADILEFGLPFTDPMADGPAIQAAGLRALKGGQGVAGTLDLVRRFRANNAATPVILMGYFNPIHTYGVDRFLDDAVTAGIDGLIVVECCFQGFRVL